MAPDDPEGPQIYEKIVKRVEENGDIHLIAQRNDTLVNALQRSSHVVLQNSRREGFALTVTEALYKETPVVARNRGGLPLQVINNKTGFLINSTNEGAKRVIQLLIDDSLRKRLGENGKKHVMKNFLITRQILDYLKMFNFYINGSKAT
jgi:trehalose synthase